MRRKWFLAYVAVIMIGMDMGWCSFSHAQMGGSGGGIGGGMLNIPGAEFDGVTDPGSIRVAEGLRVIPSVQVSERYDSNVFFSPKSQLQGLTPEDVVTTVVPQVRGLYADREQLVKVNATVGAVGSYYATNTGLSYVGANGGVVLNMNDLLSRWRPRTTWTVSNTFFYTPQPPAFLTGGPLGEQANPLVAGFQAYRTNTTSNSLNTVLELPLNRTVNLAGSYKNNFLHYGESEVPLVGTPLISQNVQVYTAGIKAEVSLYDSVRVEFLGKEFDQGELGAFNTRGGALDWIHKFSPTVSFRATGGAQLLSGELNGAPVSSVIAPVGGLAINWKDPTTSMTLAYRTDIAASFQFQAVPMLNHLVSFTMTQNTPIPGLVGLLEANYSVANNYGSISRSALSWTTVGGTAGLAFRATQKMFLTLTYGYLNVDNVFGATHIAFDRQVAQLSLAQAFY